MGSKFTCKGCEDRAPGCHDYCKKYKSEKRERDKANKYLKSFNKDKYYDY